MTREETVKALLKANNRPEKAGLYADSFIEYRAAQDNIDKNGSIVADPRTGAAVPNPFLTVRDKAFARLESLHKAGVKASVLW
jgi:phage terminase small subunit